MLRPNRSEPYPVGATVTPKFEVNSVFQQATLVVSDWVKSVVRLYPNKPYFEGTKRGSKGKKGEGRREGKKGRSREGKKGRRGGHVKGPT